MSEDELHLKIGEDHRQTEMHTSYMLGSDTRTSCHGQKLRFLAYLLLRVSIIALNNNDLPVPSDFKSVIRAQP